MGYYKDEDLMPFGKFAGEKLEDVPAYYLLWLLDKINSKKEISKSKTEKRLVEYINENMDVLEKELKDSKNSK